jgi:hypothetical protein
MQGLVPYERLRAARIAANAEEMRRLGLPELGSALRSPSTPSGSGGAGGSGGSGGSSHQGASAKRRSRKGRPGPNATPEVQPELSMVLRPRREMNYAEVDDEPKPRPAKFPRVDNNPAGAHGRAAATVDPDTKLENLDSKYDNDEKARNRATCFAVRTRSLPASYLRFLERRQRRRRTAVRVSLAMTTRAPDAFIFFARRRRCGATTSRNGSKRTRCSGARSARSGTRGARLRPRLRPWRPRSKACRKR